MNRQDFAQYLSQAQSGDAASRRRIVYRGRDGREVEVYLEIDVEGTNPDGADFEDGVIVKGYWDCSHPVVYAKGRDNGGGQCEEEECGRIVCSGCYARCGDGAEPGHGCRKGLCEKCLVETEKQEVFCEECAEEDSLRSVLRRCLPFLGKILG